MLLLCCCVVPPVSGTCQPNGQISSQLWHMQIRSGTCQFWWCMSRPYIFVFWQFNAWWEGYFVRSYLRSVYIIKMFMSKTQIKSLIRTMSLIYWARVTHTRKKWHLTMGYASGTRQSVVTYASKKWHIPVLTWANRSCQMPGWCVTYWSEATNTVELD